MANNDIVTIRCYNTEEKMTRGEAIKKYGDGVEFCEGSERERYVEILMQLLAGNTYCNGDC